MALQMAQSNASVRRTLLKIRQEDPLPSAYDARVIWQTIYSPGILRDLASQPHFWVIDALDECVDHDVLFSILSKLRHQSQIRIFMTSRPTPGLEHAFHPIMDSVLVKEMNAEDSSQDIQHYFEANRWRLPVKTKIAQQDLISRLVRQADGCFLWARLILEELKEAYSEGDIAAILQEVPSGMDSLYKLLLESMATDNRHMELTKAILTWSVCSFWPLCVGELEEALLLDIGETIIDLKSTISRLCGSLILVDVSDKVQLVHSTAADFLLKAKPDTSFAVCQEKGHTRLARTCLKYLTGQQLSRPAFRGRENNQGRGSKSVFARYACISFSGHLLRSDRRGPQPDPATLVHRFLKDNVLTWIEIIARDLNLSPLTNTAADLKRYHHLRLKDGSSEAGTEDQLINTWATDLTRLVARFGINLLSCPTAIHFLIPPLCPAMSGVFKNFGTTPQGITLTGLSAKA